MGLGARLHEMPSLRLILADTLFRAIDLFRAMALALMIVTIIAMPMLMASKLFIWLSKSLSFCSP